MCIEKCSVCFVLPLDMTIWHLTCVTTWKMAGNLNVDLNLSKNSMDLSKLEKQERRKIQFAKLKSGVSKWNIIYDSKQYVMCLVGLYSSDSKTDHAVSIAGD
jgi:hypothetical protein